MANEMILKIRQWLEDCSNHSQCGKMEGRLLPDRYLHIGRSPTDRVRLCLGDGETQGCYIALSYCWGPNNTFLLTGSKMEAFMEEIPVDQLPQTYLDLVDIARRIGFEYLWIDALCILQDSWMDWDRQAAQMAEIYGNAALTICASRASGVTEGFLHPREPFGESAQHRMLPEPVFDRGWCLQERVLSRRLLEFRRTQMMWNCLGCFDAELELYVPSTGSPMFYVESELGTQFWYELLEYHYTSCQLSRQSDRLPALAGIASVVAKTCNASYLAGHWDTDMPQTLLWYNSKRGRGRGETWRAPTWSWASMLGHLDFPTRAKPARNVDMASILNHSITLSSTSIFGEVSDGWLRISAPILHATFPVDKGFDAGALELADGTTLRGLLYADDPLDIHLSEIYLLAIRRGWSQAMWEVNMASAYNHYPGQDSSSDIHIAGLIVAPLQSGSDQFERIGYFELLDEQGVFEMTRIRQITLV